ncbi:PfkB family carbohydrate kinase [Microbacterium sp. X-17]|uniref:PfkB family carbohydrate kinase n=1 Tax=Microbacterium sp. X-17 TaxID=3144404 RepID=UPI0031F57D50
MMEPEILVIGEALIDIVREADGTTSRLPGGSPTYVAVGLSRLGHSVTELTSLGDDDDGMILRTHLHDSGVRIHLKSRINDYTSRAEVDLTAAGEADLEFAVTWAIPDSIRWDSYDIVHTGSIALALEPGASSLLNLLRHRPKHVLLTVDPNVRSRFLPTGRHRDDRAVLTGSRCCQAQPEGR